MHFKGRTSAVTETACRFTLQLQDVQQRLEYLTRVERLQESGFSGLGVDPLSADCLHCHDGITASEVEPVIRNDPYRTIRRKSRGTDHPVGMEYDRYAAFNRKFRPLAGDTGAMIFVGGKVGCLTCHDPLNEQDKHLAKSDHGSALCFTCHNK